MCKKSLYYLFSLFFVLAVVNNVSADYFSGDDFESYTATGTEPYEPNDMRYTWDPTGTASDGTNKYYYLTVDYTHGGIKALKLWFDNSFSPHFFGVSRTDSPSDWTVNGTAVGLSLWFRGAPNTDQMYVRITDSSDREAVVKYSDAWDPNDLKIEQWRQWRIKLLYFTYNNNEFDLTVVKKFEIGIGEPVDPDPGVPGGGIVYVDDIEFYQYQCAFSRGEPEADLNEDCVVDWLDVKIMAELWLGASGVKADVDQNGEVNFKDYAVMSDSWLREGAAISIIELEPGTPSGSGGNWAYGISITPPWEPGGILWANFPEHLEYHFNGMGILRYSDSRPNAWVLEQEGKFAHYEVASLSATNINVETTAEVIEPDRVKFTVKIINNSSSLVLDNVKPLLCFHYKSLSGFPQWIDNFLYTYVVIDGQIKALADIPTANPDADVKGGTVEPHPPYRNDFVVNAGGWIDDPLDLALGVITSMDDSRALILHGQPGRSMLSNSTIPCLHGDPFYGHIYPGQTKVATVTAIFVEGDWRGEVQKIIARARRPSPRNGAIDVDRSVIAGWTAGQGADSHDVYFGTDIGDVIDADNTWPVGASVYKGNHAIDANSYDPTGILDSQQVYYWRIDEVNDIDPNIAQGDVWSFTTGD
ncbi:MAG: hypothetical protein ACYS1A_03145 [Planctomycetota bacterium]